MPTFDMSFSSLMAHGGLTLLVLILASLWSWKVIFGRLLALRRAESASERLSARVAKLVRAGQLGEARDLAQAGGGSLARLLHSGLTHGSRDRAVLSEAMERRISEEMLSLEQGLPMLGTLGAVAPYVGLFGTVLGIIRAFTGLSQGAGELAGAQGVAAGIATALVATAAGLAVAIPSVVFYNLFVKRLAALEARLALAASELVEAFTDKSKRGDDAQA